MVYLTIALLAAAALLISIWLRRHQLRTREHVIRGLLDSADALEAQLHECKRRMQCLRGMLSVLPEEMSAQADSALQADAKVKAALKDLLAHRLWIQQHAGTATLQQLNAAGAALNQSSSTLTAQIERLTVITTDLETAQTSARTVAPRRKS